MRTITTSKLRPAAITVFLLCGIPLAYLLITHKSSANESSEKEKMGLIIAEKVCLFSGFEGNLTLNGEPAAGAEITRTYEWNNKKHSESLTTDSEGNFKFDSVWDKSRALFIVQFVSHQQIFVKHKDEEYQIWGGGKLIEAEYGEFGGSRPKNLRCELSEPARRVDLHPGFVGSSCHWE